MSPYRPADMVDLFGGTELPYAGTSGYAAGSSASEARARADDATGATTKRQRGVLSILAHAGPDGLTWAEVAEFFGWHHGQASGVLSVLHKAGRVARLGPPRRHRCSVYVLPEFVGDRETEPHGSRGKTVVEAWGPEPDHTTDDAPTYRACPQHRASLRALPFPMALAAARECPDCQAWNA